MSVRIVIPAAWNSELSWDKEKDLARGIEKPLFELDFDWKNAHIEWDLEAAYASMALTLDHFNQTILSEVTESSGVILYKGDLHYALRFLKIARYADHYEEWLGERADTPESALLFSTTLLTEFLHRLSSILPETLPIYCELDLTLIPEAAFRAQLLTKDRFSHLQILGEELQEASIGVVLPHDDLWSMAASAHVEKLMGELSRQGTPFRLIAESQLIQELEGLEMLYLLERVVSPQGRRMAQGFSAAGGELVYF